MSERNYIVYFELFGKKFKTTVIAKSEQEAKEKVLSKVIFRKVDLKPKDAFNETMNILDEFQEIIGGKK